MNQKSKISLIVLILATLPLFVLGQEKKQNYANAPDEMFPFQSYKDAYKYHFLEPTWFYGAGREEKAPTDLEEVRIGFLGPLDESSPVYAQGQQMLNGCKMAIDEANKKGGYKGLPFKLMIHNDVGLWGAAANEVVAMDDEKVWAFLGSIDDIVSHVALRATLKLEIFMMNSGDPDPTFSETNVPWLTRVIPDDRQASYVLVNQIYKKDRHSRVAIMRDNSRYGRVGTKVFNSSATRVGKPVVIIERFNNGETDFKTQLERIMVTKPDAILIWGNAKESGLIVKQIRAMGMKQPIYGSDRMVNPEFIKLAGPAAEGITTTCQYNPDADDPKLKEFQRKYKEKFGIESDVFAAHAYDGMNILIEAIKKAGLNRVLIRDIITDLKTFQGYQGVTGKMVFDKTWNNVRRLHIAKVKGGKFEFSLAPKLNPNLKVSPKTGMHRTSYK